VTERPLPNRRKGWNQRARFVGHTLYIRTGEYEDGTLGEVFLDISKQGTLLRGLLNAFAISVSIGLQHGAPLSAYYRAFRGMKFPPDGLVTAGLPDDPERVLDCSSIPDLLVRELAAAYMPAVLPEQPATVPCSNCGAPAEFGCRCPQCAEMT